MRKNDFLFLLLGVSYVSLKVAEKCLSKKLSSEFRYNVYLNSSEDLDLQGLTIFPEDDGKIVHNILDKEVVDLLFRTDKLPVWIDISVQEISSDFTVFKLLCSGRYSKNMDDFYYTERGSGQFGIKSPDFLP